MLPTNFSSLRDEYPQLAHAFEGLESWSKKHQNIPYIDIRSLKKELPDIRPIEIASALNLLVQLGELKIGFRVLDPRYHTFAEGGFFDSPDKIPPRLRDQSEEPFDTDEGEIVPIWQGARQ